MSGDIIGHKDQESPPREDSGGGVWVKQVQDFQTPYHTPNVLQSGMLFKRHHIGFAEPWL